MQSDSLLLASAASRILSVSPDTIRLWARTGKLSATLTSTGVRLFLRSDCERLAREREAAQHSHDMPAGASASA